MMFQPNYFILLKVIECNKTNRMCNFFYSFLFIYNHNLLIFLDFGYFVNLNY